MRKLLFALPFLFLMRDFTATANAGPMQARRAADFIDSIGVNVHLAYHDTPYYTNFPRIQAALTDLGVRHVRDNVIAGSALYALDIVPSRWRTLHAAGIQTTLISNRSLPAAFTVDLLARSPAVFAGVEGPNELDLHKRTEWASLLLTFQRDLYTVAKANPLTRSIPVLAPSLGRIENYAGAAALAPFVDAANVHFYTGGELPSQGFPLIRQAGTVSVGAKPIVVTEAGYQNALLTRRNHKPATTTATAKYIPRLLAGHFQQGFQRTFIYQLHDQTLEPQMTDPEAHFGLLHYDFTPKPAYVALRNLIRFLKDENPTPFTPGRLNVAFGNVPDTLEALLLQKKDGRFYLLLWQEAESYAVRGRQDKKVAAQTVQLEFEAPFLATVYRPGDSVSGPLSAKETRRLALAIDDAITIVALER